MSDQPKLIWRSQHVISETQRYQNPLFPREGQRLVKGGIRWIPLLLTLVVLGALSAAIWSPILRMTYITVQGNSYLHSDQVESAVRESMRGNAFLIFPRNSYLVFSSQRAAQAVQRVARQTGALESVQVTRRFPMLVAVTIRERIPYVLYHNGGQSFLVDRNGVISRTVEATQKIDVSYPELYDQTTRPLGVNAKAVNPTLLDALFTARQLLKEQTDVPIDFGYLTPVTCPVPEDQAGAGEGSGTASTNVNASSSNTNTDTNAVKNANVNTNATNKNTNSTKSTNAESLTPVLPQKPCIIADLVLSDIELRLKTKEKWDIIVRADQPVADQITRLARLLKEKGYTRSKLTFIDLRFGERVIVK